MPKKHSKEEPKISPRAIKQLAEISVKVKESSKVVNKNKIQQANGPYNHNLLEKEQCLPVHCRESACLFFNVHDNCRWLRETRTARLCNSMMRISAPSMVDSKKIKYKKTAEDATLARKISKYTNKVAIKIFKEDEEKEKARQRILRKQKMKFIIDNLKVDRVQEAKNIKLEVDEGKYSGLQSLT